MGNKGYFPEHITFLGWVLPRAWTENSWEFVGFTPAHGSSLPPQNILYPASNVICPAPSCNEKPYRGDCVCESGHFQPQHASICVPCEPGTFKSGKYSGKGSSFCSDCPAGFFSKGNATVCTKCQEGYASEVASSTCCKEIITVRNVTVEKPVYINVTVEKTVYLNVTVEVPKITQVIVQVPIEVQKNVYIDKEDRTKLSEQKVVYLNRTVEVPIEKIVYIERPVEKIVYVYKNLDGKSNQGNENNQKEHGEDSEDEDEDEEHDSEDEEEQEDEHKEPKQLWRKYGATECYKQGKLHYTTTPLNDCAKPKDNQTIYVDRVIYVTKEIYINHTVELPCKEKVPVEVYINRTVEVPTLVYVNNTVYVPKDVYINRTVPVPYEVYINNTGGGREGERAGRGESERGCGGGKAGGSAVGRRGCIMQCVSMRFDYGVGKYFMRFELNSERQNCKIHLFFVANPDIRLVKVERIVYINQSVAQVVYMVNQSSQSQASAPAASTTSNLGNYKVEMSVGLPISVAQFDESRRLSFRVSVATVASVAVSLVQIDSVQAARRSGSGINVKFGVYDSNEKSAASVAGRLKMNSLNDEFQKRGLPLGVQNSDASVSNLSASAPTSSFSLPFPALIALYVLAGVFVFGLVVYVISWLRGCGRKHKVHPRLSVIQIGSSDQVEPFDGRGLRLAFNRASSNGSLRGGQVQRRRSGSMSAIEIGTDFVRVWHPERGREGRDAPPAEGQLEIQNLDN
eukprot:768684-Hanusia_phi.AAC.1